MAQVATTITVTGRDGRTTARAVVEEYPLRLVANGRELVTLIASPHELHFLVAGFFRLQGLLAHLDDLLLLGICQEQGVAQVRLRGTVPERLRPILTSGCGTGIVFQLEGLAPPAQAGQAARFTSVAVVTLMREMQRRAERYAHHGGIHAAAVGDGEKLLLHAEDLGRHNTLDRLAGAALLAGLNLGGMLLTTSGRISTEMVAKAARLGIAVIASRTSPTDLAVAAAEAAGITLIGYLRGESCEIFSHPQRIILAETPTLGKGTPS